MLCLVKSSHQKVKPDLCNSLEGWERVGGGREIQEGVDIHLPMADSRRRQWHPTPVFLPGESQGWGAWWAALYGVTQRRT